jgi:NADPH:quinone reductase-like Zn-dependent oxidoreductase
MTASSFSPDVPATAKTLTFDPATSTLQLTSKPPPEVDLSRNDHLIRVQTTALCARELRWPTLFPEAIYSDNPSGQVTPGYDLAGTVLVSPPGSPFQPGDEIYARTRPSRPGNSREYTIARTEEMALKPHRLGWEEAATLPLSAITAWQVLFEHGGVRGLNDPDSKGKRILVTAAAGGVEVWLVQLARIAGLDVVAQVGSETNETFVRELGAVETINYKEISLKEWADKGGRADIVVDSLGGTTLEECWYGAKDGGILISIAEPTEGKKPPGLGRDVKSLFFIMRPEGKHLAEISKLLENSSCCPVLDSVFELEEYEKAFQKLEEGHARGKIVIRVDQSTH